MLGGMLVHLRLTVPTDLSDEVRQLLMDHDHVTNVVVVPGVSLDPVGDLISCDVARETASVLLDVLEDIGLTDRGGIVVITPASTPFAAARRLERLAPGDPDDAVIWNAVVAAAEASSRPTISYHVFLVLATILASVAVITDSSVLVVGAMVVGPEFGAVAATCTGVVLRRWRLVWHSLRLLVFGFVFAVAVVALLSVVGDLTGLVDSEMVSRPRPQTQFIWHPDRWSFIVALVAGAAGVLALSTDKAAAMVGVFISVTTVPAAGNLALAIGTGTLDEIWGSLSQLGLNLTGMIVAGTITLALQRLIWHRLMANAERLFALGVRKPGDRYDGANRYP